MEPGPRLSTPEPCRVMTTRRFRLSLLAVAAGVLGVASAPASAAVHSSSPAAAAAAGGCSRSGLSARRDPRNPLALPLSAHDSASSNPLSGARFFVDRKKGLAVPYLGRHPELRKIAEQPENKRFTRYR